MRCRVNRNILVSLISSCLKTGVELFLERYKLSKHNNLHIDVIILLTPEDLYNAIELDMKLKVHYLR